MTTLVYNDTKYSLPFVTTEFDYARTFLAPVPGSLMDSVVPERYMATFYKIFVNRLTFQRKLFIHSFCLNSRKHARIMVSAQLEQNKIYCKGPVGPDALPTLAIW